MTSLIAIVLWELLTLAVASKLKEGVENNTPDRNKVFVAMVLGALVVAFALLPFTF